jgi:hypothetical protein
MFVFLWYDSVTTIALTLNSVWGGLEKMLFESFALISKGWGGLVDFMGRSFRGAVAGMSVMWAGFQAGISGDLNFQQKIKDAADKAVAEVTAVSKKIAEEREAENKAWEKARQALEDKRTGTENAILDSNEKQKNAYRRGTEDMLAQSTKELAQAQKELADAIDKANVALVAQRSGLLAGGAAALKAMEEKGITPAGIAARVDQATGGPGAGSAAVGTFDSGVARFLGGTNNIELQLQQLRQQLEAQRQSKELLGYILKVLDDIRREGGGFFQ